MYWLAFQDSFSLTFLILECSSTVSSVGAGAGTSAGTGTSAAISSLSSDSESIEAVAVSDFVGWARSSYISLTELCSTKFLSSL